MRRAAFAAAVLALAACGGSAGSVGVGGQSGAFAPATAATTASWQVLDLATGAITPAQALPSLAGDPALRDRLLALRLVPGGNAALGSAAGSLARQDDEAPGIAQGAPRYLAAFELTRAQWRLIAGTSPWTASAPGGGDDLPATGMTQAQAQAALAAWSAAHGRRLELPLAWEWEVAARAGSATAFPWGEDVRAASARPHALAWETGGAAAGGPAPVGTRLANAFGLHDCVGNVWEMTADGGMRGGAWCEALALCRPANRDQLPPDTGHPAVGLRVIYRP